MHRVLGHLLEGLGVTFDVEGVLQVQKCPEKSREGSWVFLVLVAFQLAEKGFFRSWKILKGNLYSRSHGGRNHTHRHTARAKKDRTRAHLV